MSDQNWQATTSWHALERRAATLNEIRRFFSERDVLEVDTPALMRAGATDLHLDSISASVHVAGRKQTMYLQTSPEFALKRLLATHGRSIFQIAKAFRDGEAGSRHNPEFTMLEWYRPGLSFEQLMAEVADLVKALLKVDEVEFHSYRTLFQQTLDLDPFVATEQQLEALCLQKTGCDMTGEPVSHCLDLLMSHCVEPELGVNRVSGEHKLTFVYDFPASQAALSKVQVVDSIKVAKRFELYVGGSELANGYDELIDGEEQQQRFLRDLDERVAQGKPKVAWDDKLVAALNHGLQECTGVALGIERLLMLRYGYQSIADVIAFPFDRV
ncbi:EF-P lysine aminoacylase EpmA [Litoribacillus peritrichatus]|uniref:EF-P lysine aminoacylase EpmA n=1 Tax=Litoribacillus peritrichatus TaxID=718191 RepID=A0ABP7MRZ4_9GAMM